MDILQRVKSYARYLWHAKNHQRIHSPFVFNLLNEAFYQSEEYDISIQKIEGRRQQLLQNHQNIQVTDLGAGSDKWNSSERKISDIAKNSLKRKKYALLLFRITRYFKPETSLELGTSLGITASYIGQGHRSGQVVTIEGCPNIAQIAQETFSQTETENITSYIGSFDDILPEILPKLLPLDMVFIDGNHAYEPTVRYFEQTLKHAHSHTVFIFDDIHWSADMEKAWNEIKQHPKVTVTLDIYEMGIVFIRPENKVSEHFVIKY